MRFVLTLELQQVANDPDRLMGTPLTADEALKLMRNITDTDRKNTGFIMDWGEYVSFSSDEFDNKLNKENNVHAKVVPISLERAD